MLTSFYLLMKYVHMQHAHMYGWELDKKLIETEGGALGREAGASVVGKLGEGAVVNDKCCG